MVQNVAAERPARGWSSKSQDGGAWASPAKHQGRTGNYRYVHGRKAIAWAEMSLISSSNSH